MRWRPYLLLPVALLSASLRAADEILTPRAPGAPADLTGVGSQGLGTSTWIVAVLCAGAGLWLFWRNRKQAGSTAAKGKLAISETKSLGNRQYLVVAAYGKQKFLVGVCVGRITLLAPLDEGADTPSA
jgi:flagellar protein FliO/FliZ